MATGAWAQSTPATPAAAPGDKAASPAKAASAPTQALQEVIVTAQKRGQSVQKTPIAISVVQGDEIVEKALNRIEDVLKTVPGVEVQGLAQGAQVYIRGVGSSIDPAFADPAMAMMVDGAYNGRTEASVAGTYDIERIEVLAGPQGTLYGRNASGGVVNVITASPRLGKREGVVRVQFGNYGLKRGEAMVNLPLDENTLALRIAAFREKHDGYLSDGAMDQNNYGVRAKLRWEPKPGLSIIAKAEAYNEDALGANTVPVPGSAGNLVFPPPFFTTNFDPAVAIPANAAICPRSPFVGCAPILRFPDGYTPGSTDPWLNNPEHRPGYVKRKSHSFSLQIDADLGFGVLTALPSYAYSRNELSSSYLFGTLSPPSDYVPQIGKTKYESLEVRLASPRGSSTQWLAGAYYMSIPRGGLLGTETASTGTDALGNTSTFYTTQTTQPSKTLALFGQVTQPLSAVLRVTGGLRFSRDKQGMDFTIADANRALLESSGFSETVSSHQYKVGLEYDLAPQSMLYAHVASGFKQGGLSPSFPPVAFKPEELTAYEIGSKNRLLDNRLQLNASAFYYDYENYQVSVLAATPLGSTGSTGTFPLILNADKGVNKGAELALDWRATSADRVKLGLVYLDAKYGAVSLPNNPFVNQGDYSLEGKTVQNSPRWSANLGYEHVFQLGAGDLTLSFDTKWSQGYYTTPEQYLPGAWQGSYTRSDASLRYEPQAGNWSAALWVKNIENAAQTSYVFPAYRRFVTAPRTFGINAEYKF